MKNPLSLLSLLAIIMLAVPFNALANDNDAGQWYIGVAYGNVSVKATGKGGSTYRESSSGPGLRGYGGYNFNQGIGLELASLDNADVLAPIALTPKIMLAVGEKATLYGKLGMFWAEYDSDWSGSGLTAGFGLDLALNRVFRLRLSYDYLTASMDFDGFNSPFNPPEPDVDVKSHIMMLGFHAGF